MLYTSECCRPSIPWGIGRSLPAAAMVSFGRHVGKGVEDKQVRLVVERVKPGKRYLTWHVREVYWDAADDKRVCPGAE